MLQLLWNRIAYSGVARMSDETEHKNIILLNATALLLCVFSTAITITSVIFIPGPASLKFYIVPLLYSFLILGIIPLQGAGHFLAGRLYFTLLTVVFLSVGTIQLGGQTGMHFFLIVGMMLLFFIYPARQGRWMAASAALALLAFVLLHVYLRNQPGLLIGNAEAADISQLINGVAVMGMVLGLTYYVRATFQTAERYLNLEMKKSERLLLNILPPSVAAQLRESQDTIAEAFDNCTVLFSDLVGFSALSRKLSAVEVVRLLNDLFSSFDDLADKHGLEKIKTIGDAYMVVGGLPEPHAEHAERVARFALEMLEVVRDYRREHDYALELRVGISSGHAVAGVIGKRKFVYDLWGDNVNTASRMESHGVPGRVQVTESTYSLLKDKFDLEERGAIDVKGIGLVQSYLLLGELPA